ncbi:MAG TPA: XdhC family protein [Micromonosporaceae bacterium]
MRRTDLLARAEDLRQARTPYVLATVVRAQRPTSAKPGDSALILADGTFDGFVGGTCAESTVRLQGLRLLETGASTLLRITPEVSVEESVGSADEGLIVVNNPCLSGGSLEIFLEAMIPAPLLYVYGDAPVARALVRVGASAGYDMVTGSPDGMLDLPPDASAVVVASHGRGEETVLEAALAAKVPYIALVASRTRGDAVLASIGADRDRVRTPAGLDLGAHTASDVAVSILAEIIARRPAVPAAAPASSTEPAGSAPHTPANGSGESVVAVDPVCGMDVAVTPNAIRTQHGGVDYYFCGSGCKAAFRADPHRYVAPN